MIFSLVPNQNLVAAKYLASAPAGASCESAVGASRIASAGTSDFVLDVREGSDVFEVHLCPTWYRKPSEIRLKKNARIKLKGVWAEINGKDVFMASKIKKDRIK